MEFGRIALVTCESISGKQPIKYLHFSVAEHLGQNGRCRDDGNASVSANHCLTRYGEFGAAIPIHERPMGFFGQGFVGTAHSQKCCLENIQAIDFRGFGSPNGRCDRVIFDSGGQLQALPRGEQFRISEPLDSRTALVEDHGSGNNRARKTTPTNFIEARDKTCRSPWHPRKSRLS